MKQDLLGIGVILTVLGAAGFIYSQEAVPQCGTGIAIDANKNGGDDDTGSLSSTQGTENCQTIHAVQITGLLSSIGGIAIVIRSLLARIKPPGFYTAR